MGLILWIDQNNFATELLEKIFKKKSIPFYSLNHLNDFGYLVDDLRPELIVLDGETFANNTDTFLEQYEKSDLMQQLPFVLIAPKGDLTFLRNKVGEITKPFDPFAIPDLLLKLAKNS